MHAEVRYVEQISQKQTNLLDARDELVFTVCATSRSSSGLGFSPFTRATRVRVPYAMPLFEPHPTRVGLLCATIPYPNSPDFTQ